MIKFFRRIRQKLLAENRFSKYLLYAIGEIFLVMIGILLALQVNNWNEERKSRKHEAKLLKELLADINFSIKEVDTVAYFNLKSQKYLEIIEKHLDNDLPYVKVLDTAFGQLDTWHMPYIPFSAYESLKGSGIESITNDSIKQDITYLYEFGMKSLLEDNGQWEWSYNQNTTQRFMTKHIRRNKENRDLAYPIDFMALKQDDEFRNFISVLIALRDSHIYALKDMSKLMNGVVPQLEEELNNKK